jgi:hypothetical protein
MQDGILNCEAIVCAPNMGFQPTPLHGPKIIAILKTGIDLNAFPI